MRKESEKPQQKLAEIEKMNAKSTSWLDCLRRPSSIFPQKTILQISYMITSHLSIHSNQLTKRRERPVLSNTQHQIIWYLSPRLSARKRGVQSFVVVVCTYLPFVCIGHTPQTPMPAHTGKSIFRTSRNTSPLSPPSLSHLSVRKSLGMDVRPVFLASRTLEIKSLF